MGLTNSQYDEIIREYNKKQFANMHDLIRRKEEAYAKSSVFQEIDDEISSLSVQKARNLLAGEDTSLDSLKESIRALSKKRTSLLASLGYPADFLDMQYHCSDCQDTGYVIHKKCHCFKQAAIEMLYTQSNMKEILESENFEHFSYEYYSASITNPSTMLSALDAIKETVAECKNFVHHFDSEFRNLFLFGDTGVGKTFLSNCIAKELMDTYHSVIYFTAFQLFDLLAKNTFSKENDAEDLYEYVFDCDLLIIDDLGTELTNSFVSSQLFLCLNERILRKKSTIISTNLPIDIFVETYSERVFSRISSHYTMMKLFGDDIRIQKSIR